MSALFANPWYLLAGAAAALIPLLIHLLTRDRVKKVAFPTLRFFAANSRVVLARKRFHEALLIALRMLACFLLALAFAVPGLRRDNGVAPADALTAARVILVDVSASMGWPEDAAARVGALKQALDTVQPGERTAVAAFDRTARVLTPDFVDNREAVALALEKAEPGEGGTDLLSGVRLAARMLENVTAQRKEVVLVSDLQRCGWAEYQGDWRLPAGVKLTVIPVRAAVAQPVSAVTGTTGAPVAPATNAMHAAQTGKVAFRAAEIPQSVLRDKAGQVLGVRLHNYGAAAVNDLPVTLRLRGKDVETRKVNLPAGGDAPVRFRVVFDADGAQPGEIVFRADAGWPGANVYYFNVQVVPQVRVLILNGRPDAKPLNDAAFFVKLALAPGEGSPFDVRVVNATAATAADVNAATVTVLAEVDAVGVPVKDALAAQLARGGGLLFLPGDGVRPEAFAASFGGLAPCRLRRVLTPAQPMTVAKVDLEHPALTVFAPARSGNFGALQFTRYWEVSDSQLSRVLMRFADGRPFVIEKGAGKGVALLATSPVNPGWNTLPMHVLLVPYLHQMVRYLAVRTERRTAYAVGDVLPVAAGAEVTTLSGGAWTQDGAGAQAANAMAFRSGIYRIKTAAGSADGAKTAEDGELVVAVNRPLVEADPAQVEAEEITAALQISDEELRREQEKATARAQGADARLWWYVLALLCGWLAVEHLVASRTARH